METKLNEVIINGVVYVPREFGLEKGSKALKELNAGDFSLKGIEIVITKLLANPDTKDGYTKYDIALYPSGQRATYRHLLEYKIINVPNNALHIDQQVILCDCVRELIQDIYTKMTINELLDIGNGICLPYKDTLHSFGII